MPEQDRKLIRQIYSTISDIEKWQDVVETILTMTGAAKGIFSLRDRQTAELVIPPNALTSPLLVRFEDHYIESYISQYIDLDPWTEVERQRHPFSPYALSEVLPFARLQETAFWAWLEPQGISDTICVELGGSKEQWVAINIYWNHNHEHIKENILRVLNSFLEDMKQAWHLGEVLRAQEATIRCHINMIEEMTRPAFLIKQNGEFIKANSKAVDYMAKKDPILIIQQDKISFVLKNRQAEFMKILALGESQIEDGFKGEKFGFALTKLGEQSDEIGKKMVTYILSFVPQISTKNPIWETEGLTLIQREITQYYALGGSVADYCRKTGRIPATGKDHSIKIRKILGVKRMNEVREHHIVFESRYGKNPEWYEWFHNFGQNYPPV